MRTRPSYYKTMFIFVLLLFLSTFVFATDEIEIIENPKYTTEETNYSELIKVYELSENINDDVFLVKPLSLVVDNQGSIYVFDVRQAKIIKYSKDLKLLKAYGNRGKGPGDFGSLGQGMVSINLYIRNDNLLYAGDVYNQRIHCFDLDLKLKNEFTIKSNSLLDIIPVTWDGDNFFIYSDSVGLLDIFNVKTKSRKTLLNESELKYGLFYKVEKPNDLYFRKAGPTNVHYDLVGDNRLIIFLSTSGALYILENDKLLKKHNIWPKKALEAYKKELRKAINDGGFMPYFPLAFTDKDDKRFFYLYFGKPAGTDRTLIYKYDLAGNLKTVLYIKERFKDSYTKPMYKNNGLFYTFGLNDQTEETIIIYKENKK